MNILRRIRGALGMSALWGTGWGLIGLGVASIAQFFVPAGIFPANLALLAAARWAAMGALTGGGFSVAMSLAKGRIGSFDALTTKQVAKWGALGGVVTPIAFLPFVLGLPALAIVATGIPLAVVGATLGALSAVGSLRIARRAGAVELPSTTPRVPLAPHIS